MHDQASELRELVRRGTLSASTAPAPRPKLLVITGGKGGVGTTTIAVNLAVVLAEKRRRTVLVDTDPQRAAAMLLDVQEQDTPAEILQGQRTARDLLQPGPAGLQVLPAPRALGSPSEAPSGTCRRLIGQLHDLAGEVDWVVVDAGNGARPVVREFWQAADLVVVVTTSEPASVMDAYAAIKLLASPAGSVGIRTLVNKATSRSAARAVHTRVAQACLRFLGFEIRGAGYVADDPQASAAGRALRPVVIRTPRCRSARQIRRLANTVMKPSAVTT